DRVDADLLAGGLAEQRLEKAHALVGTRLELHDQLIERGRESGCPFGGRVVSVHCRVLAVREPGFTGPRALSHYSTFPAVVKGKTDRPAAGHSGLTLSGPLQYPHPLPRRADIRPGPQAPVEAARRWQ